MYKKNKKKNSLFGYSQQINLSPKSDVRVMYTKVPFPLDFRVYMFNLTNREDVRKGEQKKTNEIYLIDRF